MGELRQKMEQEMQLRAYSKRTIKSYTSAMKQLVCYCKISPARMNEGHLRSYLLYQTERLNRSPSSINIALAAFRFFFSHVCKREQLVSRLPRQRRASRRSLPVVLNEAEVTSLIHETENLRDRAMVMTLYATGLRVSELTHLKLQDLDTTEMVVHVRSGKGKKDRYVMLSHRLLETLRDYWLQYRPADWLFPAKNPERPIHERVVQRVFRKAKEKAGITKHATPHSLRHSFATRLLESGASLRYIQELLGHSSLKSTLIYTQVTRKGARRIASPLDFLQL